MTRRSFFQKITVCLLTLLVVGQPTGLFSLANGLDPQAIQAGHAQAANAANDSDDAPPEPADDIGSLIDDLLANTNEMTLYGDLLNKSLHFTGTDKQFLQRLANFSSDMADYENGEGAYQGNPHPGTWEAYSTKGLSAVPVELVKKYNISKDNPMPVLDKELADFLRNMVTDPSLNIDGVPGRGHEYLDISRLWKDYTNDNSATNKEGVANTSFENLTSSISSTHALDRGQAVDISAADYIRCTQVTYVASGANKGKIKKTVKLNEKQPMPIQFAWQTQNQSAGGVGSGNAFLGGLSPKRDGSVAPSALPALGVNFDDLLSKVQEPITSILGILGSGGWSIDQGRLTPSIGAGFDPRNYQDVVNAAADGLFRDNLAGSQYANQLPVGETGSLAGTVKAIGASIIQQQLLPNVPADVFGGSNMTDWGTTYAREQLGASILGGGIPLEGDTANDLWHNLGLAYAITKIFRLDPADGFTSLPYDTAQHMRQSLGRLAVAERIGGTLGDLTSADIATVRAALGPALDQPDMADSRLDLAAGTTARFAGGQLSADQYFELVGQAVIDSTVGAYPNDPLVRQTAYGLGLYFASADDVFLPEDTPARLSDLEKYYHSGPIKLIDDKDWKDFTTLYAKFYTGQTNPLTGVKYVVVHTTAGQAAMTGTLAGLDLNIDTLTKDDRDGRLKEALRRIIHDPTDYLGQMLNGQMPNDQWVDLGQLVLARALSSQPFQQLAMIAYLRDPNHAVWTTHVSVQNNTNPSQTITAPTITGVGQTTSVTGGQAVPVFSPDQLMNVIGLSGTDLTYIDNDLFTTLVLPRLANDDFLEATGNGNPANSFNGESRIPTWDDSFILTTLASIKEQIPNTAEFSDLRQHIDQIKPTDWASAPDSPREEKIQNITIDLAKRFKAVAKNLSGSQQKEITNLLASLAAGRQVGDIYNLTPPSDFVPDESDGLSQSLANDLYSGKISPDQAAQTVGVQYLSNSFFSPSDPKQFASDLLNTINSSQPASAATNFFNQYQSTFNNLAQDFGSSLGSQNGASFGAQQLFQTMSGNRLPLFALAGGLLFEASTGTKGNIFGKGAGAFNQANGMRGLYNALGLVGQVATGQNSVQGVLSTMLNQYAGITWADNPLDFVRNNPDLLKQIGAPADLINQFQNVFSISNPQQALQFLSQLKWKGGDIGKVLKDSLGTSGPAVLQAIGNVFTQGATPEAILQPFQKNIDKFLSTVPGGLTTDDLTGVISAVRSGNTAALYSEAATLGGKLGGKEVGAYASIGALLASGHANPVDVVTQSISSLGKLYGLKNVDQFTNMASSLTGFFTGQVKGLAGVAAAGAALADAFKIPLVGDVARVVSDPKGFGISLMAQKMSDYYGVPYDTARQAMMGLATGDYMQAGKAVASKLFSDSSLAKTLDGYLPGAKDKIIAALASSDTKGALIAVGQSLAYSGLDKVTGFKSGFAQAMITGSGEEKLNAMLDNADKLWPDMPPEGNIAIDIIKSKGDISQISSTTWAYLDGKASDAFGIPVPPGFMQGVAGVVSGKESFQDFAVGLGAQYLQKNVIDKLNLKIPGATPTPPGQPASQGLLVDAGLALVGAPVDKALGLPPGTSAQVGQIAYAAVTGTEALAAAQNNMLLYKWDPKQYDLNVQSAKNQLNSAGAGLAGLAINLAFGKDIAKFEQSLGLPPGTVNVFIQAGLSSLFSGAAFTTALASAFLPFAATLVAGQIFSMLGINIPILSSLLGGGDKTVTQVVCSSAGYYPYIKPEDDKDADGNQKSLIYDPNSNLNKYKPIAQRMKPEDVAKKLNLWTGYPGEFIGKEGIPEKNAMTFEVGRKATARWKIRQVIGEMLDAPAWFGQGTDGAVDPDYQFRQILAFDIRSTGPGDISSTKQLQNDGDYLLPYDSRFADSTFTVTDQSDPRSNITQYYPTGLKQAKGQPSDEQDPRFVWTNANGDKVGILDWPAEPIANLSDQFGGPADNHLGYGDGTPASMWSEQQSHPGEYNWGMWLEKSADFSTYIHASY